MRDERDARNRQRTYRPSCHESLNHGPDGVRRPHQPEAPPVLGAHLESFSGLLALRDGLTDRVDLPVNLLQRRRRGLPLRLDLFFSAPQLPPWAWPLCSSIGAPPLRAVSSPRPRRWIDACAAPRPRRAPAG